MENLKPYQKHWLDQLRGMDKNRLQLLAVQYRLKGRRQLRRPRRRRKDKKPPRTLNERLERVCSQTQLCQLRCFNDYIRQVHVSAPTGHLQVVFKRTYGPTTVCSRTLSSLEDNLKMASKGRNMQLSNIVIKTS